MINKALEQIISVRMQNGLRENKKIKDVILNPEGIHLDDILYALQKTMAGIIIAGTVEQEKTKNE